MNTSKNLREKLLMASVAGAFVFAPVGATAVFAQSSTETTPTVDRLVEEPADSTDTDSSATSETDVDSTVGADETESAPDATASDSMSDEPDNTAGETTGTVPGGATEDSAADSAPAESDDSLAGDDANVDTETTSALPESGDSGMTGMFLTEQGDDHVLANNYIGKSVYNQAGEKVGDINDLVFTKDGGIEAAIVGVGGFLGIGQHNVAVDFSQIDIIENPDDGSLELTIAADRDQLAEAPGFKTKEDRLAELNRQDSGEGTDGGMMNPAGTTAE